MTPLEALQAAVAAEHAAVHVLASLAGAASAYDDDLADRVSARHRVHRGRREHLHVLVRTAGGVPEPAAPAYDLPDHGNAEAVRAAVADLEERCLGTYAALVAASTGETRGWAATALAEGAVEVLGWGGEASSFPGAVDLVRP